MEKHILESMLDHGVPLKVALGRAAATVNKYRAKLARTRRGPRLVTEGGSRRQWYPGKKLSPRRSRAQFVCLEHNRRFKSKTTLRQHYRAQHSRAHAR